MRVEVRFGGEVGGQIPVMPAVVAAEEDLVAPGGPPGDPDGDGTRLSATLGITRHLGAGDGPGQLLGELDLQLMVDRIRGAAGDLLADGLIDRRVAVAEDDRADAADPVDIFV